MKEINHQWFNKQKPEFQAEMNKAFQEYKQVIDLAIAHTTTNGIQQAKKIKLEEPKDYISIPLIGNDKLYEEHKKQRNERVFKKFEGVER